MQEFQRMQLHLSKQVLRKNYICVLNHFLAHHRLQVQ